MGIFNRKTTDAEEQVVTAGVHEFDGVEANPLSLDPQTDSVIKKTREEKKFLLKLDFFLLAFGCITQVIKYLDQTNITTAYVSGMSDDLNFEGNELNYFTTYFNVGYCIFLIPSQVFISRFRPSWWLPGLELLWGILTGIIAVCKTSEPIYALRAFIGAAESSCYPGTVTMLMAWYTPLEMAKRIGFYHSCQAVGGMLSGALQAAIHNSMENAHGIRGWQWTFIINCIMTVGLALVGPFLIPDFPDRPNPLAFWLTKRDREIAQMRLSRFRRVDIKPINWATAKRTAKNPIVYMMIYIYVGMLIAVSGIDYFQLWLKSLKDAAGNDVWGTTELNAIPMGGRAMQIVGVWAFAFASDFFRTRWLILIAICIVGIPSCIIMIIWNVSRNAIYYAYFILFMLQSGGPPLWAWLSDMCPTDAEQRALILGVSNVLIFPAKQAPHYKYGWPVSLALWITCGMMICVLRWYDIKVVRPRNYREAQEAQEAYDAAQVVEPTKADDEVEHIEVRDRPLV